ncbi:MAG: molybdate transport system substrate-binding protein [Bradyrhizobium sp.]|jgi:molybdate transport system substrate-binding protein|nr:molybdate transport system substrate-binding protein [Bradyrhizobium sp.]
MKRPLLTAAGSMLGVMLAVLPMNDLRAAELKMLAGGSMAGLLNELAPQFERTSGYKLVIHFDSTPNLIKQATSGAAFDLGLVPIDVMKDQTARARFATGPTTDVARVGYGIAVRAGAPKPDVSTSAALKKTLLDAQSIAYIPASAAGAYVSSVFERLGIAEAMKAKTKTQTTPAQIPQAVANGEAELGVFVVSVLMAPGVELAGSFPSELQQELVFSAAVAADTKEAEAAKAFIDYLTSPAVSAMIKAKGMTPG